MLDNLAPYTTPVLNLDTSLPRISASEIPCLLPGRKSIIFVVLLLVLVVWVCRSMTRIKRFMAFAGYLVRIFSSFEPPPLLTSILSDRGKDRVVENGILALRGERRSND